MSTNIIGFRASVASTVKGIFSFRNALVGLAGVVVIGSLRRIVKEVSQLQDTADKLGITVEALQAYRFAAEQTGVATQTLDMALQRFTRRLGEAQAGGGELLGTIKQYSIAMHNADGTTRSVEAVLRDYADTIAGAASSQEQLRLAFKGFDSEGAALVNLYREGSAGLDEYRRRAEQLGIIISGKMTSQIKQAGDALNVVDMQMKSANTRIAFASIPLLEGFGRLWSSTADRISNGAMRIASAMSILGLLDDPVVDAANDVARLSREVSTLEEELANVAAMGTLSAEGLARTGEPARLESLRAQLVDARAAFQDLLTAREDFFSDLSKGGGGAPVVDEVAQAIDRLATSTAAAKFEATALAAGMSEQEIAIRKTLIGMGLMNQAGELNANLTEQQRAEVRIYVDALRGLAVMNEDIEATTKATADAEAARQELIDRGVTVTDNMRTAQEIYNDRLEELNELLAAGTINQQTFSRAVKQAHDTLEDSQVATEKSNDLARDLGMTFTSAFEDAVVAGGELSDVLRGLEQDLIRLVMRQLVMQPLLDAGTSFFSGLSFGGTGAPSGLGPGINRGFATGGTHTGGFRMVGERGPELESTGPARYFSAEKTRGMMTGGGGEVTVNVYAPPGSSVEQRETTGPGGRSIDIIIDELTARNIGTPGSRTGRAIRNSFAGVNPQLQGR